MNYVTYQQKDCFTGCIVNALRAFGIDVSEADVLLYGGGFRIRYRTIATQDNSKYLIYGELREACLAFLEKVGLRFEFEELGTLEKGMEKYRSAKSEGANVMFSVCADCIGYDPIFRQASDSFHCLNILDIDEDKGEAIVSDGYIPTTPVRKYEGIMPLDNLFTGYEKTKCTTLVIYPPNRPIKFRQDNENESICSVLKQYLASECDGEYYTGCEAIIRLCNDLNRIKDWEREPFCAKLMDFNTVYKTWGFIGVKRILAELCRERESLASYYEEMDEIAEKWNGLSRYIVKIALSYRPTMIDQFKEKAVGLISQEKELYKKMIAEL